MTPNSFFQSFLTHLDELRSRLIKAGVAFIIAACACYNYVPKLLPLIIAPAGHLIFTSPSEAFGAYMTLTMVMAFFVASPFIFYQLWAFVGGALRPNERGFVKIFAPLSLLFFFVTVFYAHAALNKINVTVTQTSSDCTATEC